MKFSFAGLALFASHAAAFWRTSPPKGAIVVDQSGRHSDITTVQAGVDALSTTEEGLQSLFIYPGTYQEQVFISERAANLSIYGYTWDKFSYHLNAVTITQNLSQEQVPHNDLTATVRAHSSNFKMYNLNLENTYGEGSQALALSAQATNQGYYGVGLFGYQDTLLANEGRELYAKGKITGATDFIFGQRARAWLENMNIRVTDDGYITANGRDDAENESFYVISKSSITGVSSDISTYLGRPWRNFSRVVVQYTYLGSVIEPSGWSIWNPGDERTSNVTYAEYGNYGPSSVHVVGEGARASFSEQLDEPVTKEDLFGEGFESEWWVDMDYLH
ncbi:pectinesterase [Hortaea werneckii]|uniref:Pectinesterase n=2 Tax=Hortaea werneckii TaxID=91943 RepID=A0A3M7HFD9_HORWE|nr:pectinesterase [Hortaea werneckii]OTA38512.1 hypothetical protein BTJ68_01631 [Hortaea werneckii EXF-2000]KAI6832857.1 pectinesterase [Hortaea werneckii]KAI6904400.1 pectinesterase [Hortaea werneckii]KAI6927292.1 pectinesterase [Hortaea werneckii]